jgi:CBS domain containing-hemolysin-like protein
VGLLAVVLLIAANGLFVAAEFALVATKRPSVEAAVAAGDRRAKLVLSQLRNLSFVLSAAQFGITATSLVVGFLAEPAISEAIVQPILVAVGMEGTGSRAIGLTIAFLLSTITQMLFGELAPKNLAIARPDPVSRAVAIPMWLFGVVLGPIIRIFDRSAAWLSQRVFRVEHTEELLGGHSLDELARIITASTEEGQLSEHQAELLGRAVEHGNRRAHEVMVPRPDVVFLAAEATPEDLRAASRETGHSRFPVRGESEDDVIGTVHIRDVLDVPPEARATTTLASLVSPVTLVPESFRLRRLINQLRAEHRTFAVVVDEYGGTAGIVTFEDILEELVGEIEDEFDPTGHVIRRVGAGRHLVRGSTRIERVEAQLGIALPEGEYETLAGFVLDQLGHIPELGEEVVYERRTFTVTRREGVRVTEIAVTGSATARADGGDGR